MDINQTRVGGTSAKKCSECFSRLPSSSCSKTRKENEVETRRSSLSRDSVQTFQLSSSCFPAVIDSVRLSLLLSLGRTRRLRKKSDRHIQQAFFHEKEDVL